MSDESYKLTVEGGLKVLYKGTWVSEIPFDVDQMTIGVLDPENNIYPDINLRQYRLEGEDPYISRRHARFFRSENKYYIEDICRNNSTSINTKGEIINGLKRELTPGNRIFISESLVFCFVQGQVVEQPAPSADKVPTQPDAPASAPTQPTDAPASAPTQPTDAPASAPTQPTDAPAPVPGELPEAQTQALPSNAKSPENQTQALSSEMKADEAPVNPGELKEVEEPPEPKTPSNSTRWYLDIESKRPIFFKLKNIFTSIIELNPEEWEADTDGKKSLHIGRHSTDDQIYPEIDLWKFYFNDGDEYIARRHARIFESDGKLYFQDLSGKGSTWHAQKDDEHRLLHTPQDEAKIELTDKLVLFISDAATFTVKMH